MSRARVRVAAVHARVEAGDRALDDESDFASLRGWPPFEALPRPGGTDVA